MYFEPANFSSSTSLQGRITVTYARLVEVFGAPHSDGDGEKADAQWRIAFEDGTMVTIYNYKDGYNYCGVEGAPIYQITDWHVGGHSRVAVEHVREVLKS
jgi:hypothetical protein